MSETVNAAKRTRRAEKAQQTHRRIVEAATRLFLERGYVPTTIEAIADAADVAVETVYARFRTKANLMVAVKDAAVTEGGGIPLAQRPELAPLAAEIDRRRDFQKTLVDLVRAHGPLRHSLTPSQAADTYSALANPELYLLLTTHHGWTPSQFQTWLADSLQLLLLPQALNSRSHESHDSAARDPGNPGTASTPE